MKSLLHYLSEDGALATPSNTIGMGDPVADDGDGKCSEPLTGKAKKEKFRKKPKKCSEEE